MMGSTSKQIVVTIASLLVAAQPIIAQASQGCFKSSTGLQNQGAFMYQSTGYCQKQCTGLNLPVFATTGGSECWCGSQLPPASSKTSDSDCSKPCQGFPAQMCGGDNAWSVALTGIGGAVSNAPDDTSAPTSDAYNLNSASSASQTASPPTTAAPAASTTPKSTPSVVTVGNTVVVTAPGQTTTAPAPTPKEEKSKGPNTAGIAAGVVVGVAAVCAIAGGLFLFLRHRRRRAVEDEYRRNASINNITGSQKPSSAGSISDSRLEPSVMMQRRQSDGSIADNQDYSRRILKVMNPDGT